MNDIKQDILEYLLWIPKWKVMTYKTLADVFWVHPRKVAMTLKYNDAPGYFPCYKVISHSWKVWWYNSWEWENTKIKMLRADGIEVIDGKVSREYIV
jgi:alkylated DNA nucleotide flippase Atl1